MKSGSIDDIFVSLTEWLKNYDRQAKDVMWDENKKNNYILVEEESYYTNGGYRKVFVPKEFDIAFS